MFLKPLVLVVLYLHILYLNVPLHALCIDLCDSLDRHAIDLSKSAVQYTDFVFTDRLRQYCYNIFKNNYVLWNHEFNNLVAVAA